MLSISPSTNINRVVYNTLSRKETVSFQGKAPIDTITISKAAKDIEIKRILDKLKKFSIDEYNKLSTNERQKLMDRYLSMVQECENNYIKGREHLFDDMNTKLSFRKVEKMHDMTANWIKKSFDDKYGENNYIVITIGRSLSSIGKTLGYKIGESNVINLPLSSSQQYLDPLILKDACSQKNELFKELLQKHNLTKDVIDSSDKKYIILDYCCTGNSLKGAKKLLESEQFIGSKNLEAIDLKDCIPDYDFYSELDSLLCKQRFKHLSFVKKYKNLDSDVNQALVDTSELDINTRLILFRLLHSQMVNTSHSCNGKSITIPKWKCDYHKQIGDINTWFEKFINSNVS